MEQLQLQLVPIWDACIANNDLTGYTTMLAPRGALERSSYSSRVPQGLNWNQLSLMEPLITHLLGMSSTALCLSQRVFHLPVFAVKLL